MNAKKSILIIFLGVVILLSLIVIINFLTISLERNGEDYQWNAVLINDSISENAELEYELNNKIILRLMNGYCSPCIEIMLTEINENISIDSTNFVIVTQFENKREFEIFKQFTRHSVINYPENILPLDTMVKYQTYFMCRKDQSRLYFYEYSKGSYYQGFVNRALK